MFLNPIQLLYHSIPGQKGQDKALFIGKRASETLPWVIGGFFLNKDLSQKFQFDSQVLPEITRMIPLPYPLSHLGAGLGIANQFNEFKLYSKKLTTSSNWSDRVLFLLLAYSTIICAYNYFQAMIPQAAGEEPVHEKEKWASRFTIGLVGMSLAIQLRYRPIWTLVGLAVGVAIRKYRHLLTADNITPYLPKEVLEYLSKSSIEEMLSVFIKSEAVFSNPQTSAQKCYHVWLAWNALAYAVTSDGSAFFYGIDQGQTLAAYFIPFAINKFTFE